MKTLILSGSLMFTLLTAVEPIWAQEEATVRTSIEEAGPAKLSDLGMHINPQLGVSSFEYSGTAGGGGQKLSGGATAEFGGSQRKFETGLLLMQTSANTTLTGGANSRINVTYLTLPMMAKLRIVSLPSQSWYAKFGFMTALQVGSSDRNATSGADVLTSAGLGGRFGFNKKSDFIVEATYNRGLLESISTSQGSSYNQGVLVMAGLSFSI